MTNTPSRGYSPPRVKVATVRPLMVYAAASEKFEVCAPADLDANTVKAELFLDLPLEEHSWSRTNSVLTKLTTKPCGQHWLLSRGRL